MPDVPDYRAKFPKLKLRTPAPKPLDDSSNPKDLTFVSIRPKGQTAEVDSKGRPLPIRVALVDEDEGVIGFSG
jgi:hypothetical protein